MTTIPIPVRLASSVSDELHPCLALNFSFLTVSPFFRVNNTFHLPPLPTIPDDDLEAISSRQTDLTFLGAATLNYCVGTLLFDGKQPVAVSFNESILSPTCSLSALGALH